MEDIKKFLNKFPTLESAERLDLLNNAREEYREEVFKIYNYFKSIGRKVVFIAIDTKVDEMELTLRKLAKFQPSVTENKLIVITLPTLEDLKERDEKSTIIKIDDMTIETFPITSLPNQLLQRRDILDKFTLYENSVKTFPKIREYLKYYLGYFPMKPESNEVKEEKDQVYFYYGIQAIILGAMKDFIQNC